MTTPDGKCCLMVTDKVLTYDDAVSYCKESHGGLLAVESKEKQSCLENFLKSKYLLFRSDHTFQGDELM